jgi:hypothetical protein
MKKKVYNVDDRSKKLTVLLVDELDMLWNR